MSVTLRFQSSGAVPGNAGPVTMRGPSLTIGRGPDNDLVLPDPDRMVSKTHCVIENHNGNLVAVDLSTNGTFLNYGKIPLGRTPTPINDGDVLSLGPYELVVAVAAERPQEPPPPMPEARASHGNAAAAPDPMQLLDDAGPGGDFLDDLLGDGPKGPAHLRLGKEEIDPLLLPPLGEDDDDLLAPPPQADSGPAMPDHGRSGSDAFRSAAPTRSVIPDDWEEDLLSPGGGTPADPFAAPPPFPSHSPAPPPAVPRATPPGPPAAAIPPLPDDTAPPPTAAPMPVAPAPTIPQPQPPASAPAAAPASDDAAARAFLAALGAQDVAVSDTDLAPVMTRLGGTLRAMITGLREILMTRNTIKSEFRIDQTMISAGGNNPLKFSVSPELAIEAMVRPSVRGYLDAQTAAEQVLDDIKAHEVAMVTGMEAALKGVLARLDPAVLAGRIEAKGGIGGLIKGRKAQYWETYEKIYAEVSDQAENDFHDLFSREFAQAYKEQLARLKKDKR